jgi:hypothetical protein
MAVAGEGSVTSSSSSTGVGSGAEAASCAAVAGVGVRIHLCVCRGSTSARPDLAPEGRCCCCWFCHRGTHARAVSSCGSVSCEDRVVVKGLPGWFCLVEYIASFEIACGGLVLAARPQHPHRRRAALMLN